MGRKTRAQKEEEAQERMRRQGEAQEKIHDPGDEDDKEGDDDESEQAPHAPVNWDTVEAAEALVDAASRLGSPWNVINGLLADAGLSMEVRQQMQARYDKATAT